MIEPLGGRNRWLVYLVLAVALTLMVYPMPLEWRWWRPEFVLLVVLYWAFAMPDETSLTLVFALGLIQDLLVGSPLGQHALGLTLVTFLALQSYRRVANYALWQQACWVFLLVGIARILANWVHALGGGQSPGLWFLLPALISALLWPLCHLLFDTLRLRYRIH